jgi:hypothetical protein
MRDETGAAPDKLGSMDPADSITITPDPVVLRLQVPAPKVLMKTNLWYNWARIAVEHERAAVAAREELKRVWTLPGASRNILTEMHPSMVAIVACALAFDALHADVASVVGRDPDPRRKRQRQWVYMLETFIVALPAAAKWHAELSWLISQRDNAVHFRGFNQEPVPHPELPTNVSPQNVEFSRETATRAVNLLLLVFRAVLGGSESDSPIAMWGHDRRHVLAELERLREATATT